jgi:hypothetical protein
VQPEKFQLIPLELIGNAESKVKATDKSAVLELLGSFAACGAIRILRWSSTVKFGNSPDNRSKCALTET